MSTESNPESELPIWRRLCAQKQKSQHDSIPRDWLIAKLPLQDHPNVFDVPAKCGLLTERELMITETTDVGLILRKLRTAKWSSLETTTAFYKRAVVAHQLVGLLFLSLTYLFLRFVND